MPKTTEERRAYNRAYRAANKEKLAAQRRAYRLANPEKIAARERAQRVAHKEEITARLRAYYVAHKEEFLAKRLVYTATHKEQISANKRAYYAAHKEERAAYNRAYYAAHKEELSAYQRAYIAAHPGYTVENANRRRARKLGASVNDLTAAQWREILAAYDHRCVYCQRKMKRLTKDHIIPLAKGGTHTFSNIVPACMSCNNSKRTGPPLRPVQPLLLTMAASRKA